MRSILEFPHLEFERPTSHYTQEEEVAIVMLPSSTGEFQVRCSPSSKDSACELLLSNNRVTIKQKAPPGNYFLKARWRGGINQSWTRWSPPLRFSIHEEGHDLSIQHEWEHRLSLMLEKGVGGAITLVDPEAEPPGLIGQTAARWFATPVYEGATSLVNEDVDYYLDPFLYYLDCIDHLVNKKATFLTWHDVLDGRHDKAPLEILLQFDVDGGPKSMERIYNELAERGIRATLMIHRRGHHWYPYEFSSAQIAWMAEAESLGWSIGYHNNALSQVVGDKLEHDDKTLLDKAVRVFADDIRALREHFEIKTFTHHGGNVYNLNVVPPPELDVIGVDRRASPSLWESIATMFSDGGFVSRPSTLRKKVESVSTGLHFFRNHPFKYANYMAPVDVPPRHSKDLSKVSLPANDETLEWQRREIEKETSWLHHRQASRSPIRLSYLRLEKPISSRFSSDQQLDDKIERIVGRRQLSLRRYYPWSEGDPTVFWWRMLEAWAPKIGSLLKVGTLPHDSTADYAELLSPGITIQDIWISSGLQPDSQWDIFQVPAALDKQFNGTALFGLSHFAAPRDVIAACARATITGGIGLFSLVSDTDPASGSLFHPWNRHLWRRDKEPLANVGPRGNLWAFDQDSVMDIFDAWSNIEIEFMGHYWFVVAKKT